MANPRQHHALSYCNECTDSPYNILCNAVISDTDVANTEDPADGRMDGWMDGSGDATTTDTPSTEKSAITATTITEESSLQGNNGDASTNDVNAASIRRATNFMTTTPETSVHESISSS